MTDCINRKAAKWNLYREFIHDKDACLRAFKALNATPPVDAVPNPADSIPRILVDEGINNALEILDGINGEEWFSYENYSRLHDAISSIGFYGAMCDAIKKTCADMRGESHDG